MRIHHTNRLGNVNPYQKHQEQQGIRKSGLNGKQRDEVQISTEAKQLAAGSSVRSEKIEALKQAVASGSYKVDAQQLAEKMLNVFKG